ncbi:hypothetical protein JCM16303_003441 [Sporobolomyces ruberrimus]
MTRRRSGSLELDYGDDPLQEQDLANQDFEEDTKPKPIATLEVAKKEFVDSRPIIAQPKPNILASTSAPPTNLPMGLPANPLTGRIPSTGAQSPMNSASGTGAGQGGNSQLTAVFISDMHWWTSDQHLVELCHLSGAGGVKLKDVSFSEHKVNGKSKGVAYIETGSAEAATLVKRYVDSNEYQQKRMTCTLVTGANLGSPFRTLPREPHQRQQPGSSSNPANQPSRPGLRIPPPCTYPYINSRDQNQSNSSGGGSGGQGGSLQKRQYNNGPGQSMGGGGGGGGGMGMGMSMTGQQSYGNGAGGGGNRNQNFPNNNPSQPLPQQQPQNNGGGMMGGMNGMGGMGGMNAMGGMGAMGGFGDPSAAMGGMNMFGMNPFGMGGMGGMMGGFNPAFGMGGAGGAGGFDMSQFGAGAGGGMDFSQMGQFGGGAGMMPQGQANTNGGAKRSRTDGQ